MVVALLGAWLTVAGLFVWVEAKAQAAPPEAWSRSAIEAVARWESAIPDLVRLRIVAESTAKPGCLPARSTVLAVRGSPNAYAVVSVVICSSADEASGLVAMANGSPSAAPGSTLEFRGRAIPELGRSDLRFRLWSNGAAIYQVSVLCREDRPCSHELVTITQSLLGSLPTVGEGASNLGSTVIIVSAVLLACAWAGVALRSWIRMHPAARDTPAGLLPPGFQDVTPRATLTGNRLMLVRTGWLAVGVGTLDVVLAGGLTGGGGFLPPWLPLALGALLIGVGRGLPARALTSFRVVAATDPAKLRRGRNMVFAARAGLTAVVALLMMTLLAGIVANQHPVIAVYVTQVVNPVAPASARILGFLLAGAYRGYVAQLVLLLLALPLLQRLYVVGLRTRAASVPEVEQASTPYFLLLRSFDEDQATIRTSVLNPSLLPRLVSPLPVRPFEEVVAHALGEYAPVVAISPPSVQLPALGAAKVNLKDADWQGEVRRWASEAIAVVILATPAKVSKDGFGWELRHLSEHLGHSRFLLVLGPWPTEEARTRWLRFRQAVSEFGVFSGVRELDVPGTRVIARASDSGWSGYVSRTTTDAAYIVAVDTAVRNHGPAWIDERLQELGRELDFRSDGRTGSTGPD